MKTIPTRKRHWVEEIEKALETAQKKASSDGAELAFLYRYAQPIMMRKRGIKDSHVANEIYEYIEELVGQDWRIDPASKQYFIFHFVSSYLFAHVAAGYLEEKEADRIMDYLNENMRLFV